MDLSHHSFIFLDQIAPSPSPLPLTSSSSTLWLCALLEEEDSFLFVVFILSQKKKAMKERKNMSHLLVQHEITIMMIDDAKVLTLHKYKLKDANSLLQYVFGLVTLDV